MIKINNHEIEIGHFPNGESYVDIPNELFYSLTRLTHTTIKFFYTGDSDIFTLKMLKDFLDNYNITASLFMPYIPYSRMDRKENNRLFSLKTFAEMINSMNFTDVTVLEPHSDVSVALIDRVKVSDYTKYLLKVFLSTQMEYAPTNEKTIFDFANKNNYYLVFPDAGAEKRYSKQIKYPKYLTCSKHRDFDTGKIDKLTINNVPDNMEDGFTAIIVDDLCSKGGTFILTAQELRKLPAKVKDVYLIVTHTENTVMDGKIPTTDDITGVYTTNSIFTGDCPKIHIIKV